MVAPYIAILVHRYSWDVLATVDLLMAAVVVRRRACLGHLGERVVGRRAPPLKRV